MEAAVNHAWRRALTAAHSYSIQIANTQLALSFQSHAIVEILASKSFLVKTVAFVPTFTLMHLGKMLQL